MGLLVSLRTMVGDMRSLLWAQFKDYHSNWPSFSSYHWELNPPGLRGLLCCENRLGENAGSLGSSRMMRCPVPISVLPFNLGHADYNSRVSGSTEIDPERQNISETLDQIWQWTK